MNGGEGWPETASGPDAETQRFPTSHRSLACAKKHGSFSVEQVTMKVRKTMAVEENDETTNQVTADSLIETFGDQAYHRGVRMVLDAMEARDAKTCRALSQANIELIRRGYDKKPEKTAHRFPWRFVIEDGRHEYVAALMLGHEALLVAWVEAA